MSLHVCGALLSLAALPAGDAPAPPPSIVVIIADDWSWPHAGAGGDRCARTPAFDRVAREGVLFRRAFCAAPSAIAPFFRLAFAKRPEEELYDVANDPGQLTNLAASPEHAEVKAGLRRRVAEGMRATADPRLAERPEDIGRGESPGSTASWDSYPYFGGGPGVERKAAPEPKSP